MESITLKDLICNFSNAIHICSFFGYCHQVFPVFRRICTGTNSLVEKDWKALLMAIKKEKDTRRDLNDHHCDYQELKFRAKYFILNLQADTLKAQGVLIKLIKDCPYLEFERLSLGTIWSDELFESVDEILGGLLSQGIIPSDLDKSYQKISLWPSNEIMNNCHSATKRFKYVKNFSASSPPGYLKAVDRVFKIVVYSTECDVLAENCSNFQPYKLKVNWNGPFHPRDDLNALVDSPLFKSIQHLRIEAKGEDSFVNVLEGTKFLVKSLPNLTKFKVWNCNKKIDMNLISYVEQMFQIDKIKQLCFYGRGPYPTPYIKCSKALMSFGDHIRTAYQVTELKIKAADLEFNKKGDALSLSTASLFECSNFMKLEKQPEFTTVEISSTPTLHLMIKNVSQIIVDLNLEHPSLFACKSDPAALNYLYSKNISECCPFIKDLATQPLSLRNGYPYAPLSVADLEKVLKVAVKKNLVSLFVCLALKSSDKCKDLVKLLEKCTTLQHIKFIMKVSCDQKILVELIQDLRDDVEWVLAKGYSQVSGDLQDLIDSGEYDLKLADKV